MFVLWERRGLGRLYRAEPGRPAELAAETSPLNFFESPTSYLFKQRPRQQEGVCSDPEPYYSIVYDRGDDACLARKLRLAAKEVDEHAVLSQWRHTSMRAPPQGPPPPFWRRGAPQRIPERSRGRLGASCGANIPAQTRSQIPRNDDLRVSNQERCRRRA